MSTLYRLVYTSQNLLRGSDEQRAAAIAEILAVSRRNNGRVGVSGALLFNGGSFAQVLEGPREAVEATFERIQRDPRHSEVSVLQCEAVAARGFPHWSMAFAGHSARGRALWDDLAERTGFDLARIEGDHLFATLHAIVMDEEGVTDEALSVPPVGVTPSAGIVHPGSRHDTLDVERLRSELQEQMPENRPVALVDERGEGIRTTASPEASDRQGRSASEAEGIVLRAALDEERQRTTELRRALDEARIALTAATREIEVLRQHGTVWASRAKALASALCQEPVAVGEDEVQVGTEAQPFRMRAAG